VIHRWLAAAAFLVLPSSLIAQGSERYAVALLGQLMRSATTVGQSRSAFDGVLVGAEGRFVLRRLSADFTYTQGSISASAGGTASRDVVDGRLSLGVRPAGWLWLRFGPHARGFVINGVTQRWVMWEARARADASLAGPNLRAYAELWGVLSGTIANLNDPFDSGRGGEAGVLWIAPRFPLHARLAYSVERQNLGRGARFDTVEGVTLAVGIGRAK